MNYETAFYTAMLILIVVNIWYTFSAIEDYYDGELMSGDVVACVFSWLCLVVVIGFEVVL